MKSYHHGNLREALIDRAIAVIDQDGLEGLSLRRIAKDLGVSHAAPARHFKSKTDLLAVILRDSLQELTETIFQAHTDKEAHADETDNAIVQLNLMARRSIRWAIQNKAKFSVMINPDVSRFADDALIESMKDFSGQLFSMLKAAQDLGFREEISDKALLLYAIGACRGVSAVLTDNLLSSVLRPEDDEKIITDLANQIVPL